MKRYVVAVWEFDTDSPGYDGQQKACLMALNLAPHLLRFEGQSDEWACPNNWSQCPIEMNVDFLGMVDGLARVFGRDLAQPGE